MLCNLARMEPYYIQCIKDGPFQPKTAKGANKPEAQCSNNKRRVSKNEGLVAETFDSDEQEVSDDDEMTQVKVLMALADEELVV
ncbi:hypothetical protein Tco_0659888 [Tanacetum coccineum]